MDEVTQEPLALPLNRLPARLPLFVEATATVQEAARLMTEANVTSVLVHGDPPGILTDRDLRRRVVAAGLGPHTLVADVMSRPLRTLDSDTPVHGAMLMMLEQGIHHVALVEEGQVVGLVTSSELRRHQSHSPLYLQAQLQNLDTPAALQGYSAETAQIAQLLLNGGMGAAQIGRIISSLNDALVQRLARTAERELGPPPVPYAWVVFGSEGRSEQIMLTDQDNALVYAEESEAAQAYFGALAQRMVGGLLAAGFPPCPGGYMATNWCLPLSAWMQHFDNWLHVPEPQALMEAGIFFDFRSVHGELSLEPLDRLLATAQHNGLFITHLLRAAQQFAPPLGLFNRIRTEDGSIDIKFGGLAPIVSLTRALSLAAGSRKRSTLERLAAAEAGGKLSGEGAGDLSAAFTFLLELRLRRQLAARDAGLQPNNRIVLNELPGREQKQLRDYLVRVRELQDAIGERA
jgi:CBS domain-containing protein